MSASQRRKGACGENELANLLTDLLGFVVRRNLGAARDGGDDITIGKFRIECKRRAKIAIHEWMEQAIDNCKEGTPVLAFRADGEAWIVCFRLLDAVELMSGEL
jgi:hypothetical protein